MSLVMMWESLCRPDDLRHAIVCTARNEHSQVRHSIDNAAPRQAEHGRHLESAENFPDFQTRYHPVLKSEPDVCGGDPNVFSELTRDGSLIEIPRLHDSDLEIFDECVPQTPPLSANLGQEIRSEAREARVGKVSIQPMETENASPLAPLMPRSVSNSAASASRTDPHPDRLRSRTRELPPRQCKTKSVQSCESWSTTSMSSDEMPEVDSDSSQRSARARRRRCKLRTATSYTLGVAYEGEFASEVDFKTWVRDAFFAMKRRLKATGVSLHVRSLKFPSRQYTLVSRFSRKQKGFRRYFTLPNSKAEAVMCIETDLKKMKALRATWLNTENASEDSDSMAESEPRRDDQLSRKLRSLSSPSTRRLQRAYNLAIG